MTTQFTVNGKLPTLNDYTNRNRTHWGAGATDKKNATEKCANACVHLTPTDDKPIILHYTWCSSTKHDLDNLAFGQKFVQDGLKLAGKIKDDSRKIIKGFTHDFEIAKKNEDCVIVSIEVI